MTQLKDHMISKQVCSVALQEEKTEKSCCGMFLVKNCTISHFQKKSRIQVSVHDANVAAERPHVTVREVTIHPYHTAQTKASWSSFVGKSQLRL